MASAVRRGNCSLETDSQTGPRHNGHKFDWTVIHRISGAPDIRTARYRTLWLPGQVDTDGISVRILSVQSDAALRRIQGRYRKFYAFGSSVLRGQKHHCQLW
jgi:hypothetical protein